METKRLNLYNFDKRARGYGGVSPEELGEFLDNLGFIRHGRVKFLSEKTGFDNSSVSRMLSGRRSQKLPLRFLTSVNAVLKDWITELTDLRALEVRVEELNNLLSVTEREINLTKPEFEEVSNDREAMPGHDKGERVSSPFEDLIEQKHEIESELSNAELNLQYVKRVRENIQSSVVVTEKDSNFTQKEIPSNNPENVDLLIYRKYGGVKAEIWELIEKLSPSEAIRVLQVLRELDFDPSNDKKLRGGRVKAEKLEVSK